MQSVPIRALALLVAACAAPVFGQAPVAEDPNKPEMIELTVAPAPEPRPALKYRLIPATAERTPGNAAPFYYRALLHLNNLPKDYWKPYDENLETWLSPDPGVFPKDAVAKWLPSGAWRSQLEVAAYREYCDWDYRIQDLRGMEVIGFLLQETQDCRSLARVLRLQAHYEIMDGRPEDAIKTLRLGYQLAHDVAQPPLLINGLVGIACASLMNEELQLLIDRGGPNMYWAIASLPQPLVSLRRAMEFEMGMPQQLFPFLKDAETAQRTPDEWRKLMIEGLIGLQGVAGESQPELTGWQAELAAAAVVAKLYPIAKDALIASGMDRQWVEEMPVGQVVAIHTARSTEYVFQEFHKLSLLPYGEAMRRSPKIRDRLIQEGHLGPGIRGPGGLPIAALLLPAVEGVRHAEIRIARNFAALQAIEAMRMHAAETGKLPATLSEVTVVPVPDNPATSEPFPYQYDAATNTATLEVPASPGQQARHEAKRYVIRLVGN
ncbi:MAG TPA: hypothetical protein VFV87_01600 [Pirellulaceae bacterium]|nr:hypothetical protein [Pirellulaceae bacterium]